MINTLNEFQRTRVIMTKTAYIETYSQPEETFSKDCFVVSVFADIFHIEHCVDGEFLLQLGNSSYKHPDIYELAKDLWEDFAKDELNAGHWHARIRELQEQYSLKPVSGDELQVYGLLAMSDEHIIELIDLIRKIKGND